MVDHGYNPQYLTRELEKIYPQIMTKIKFKLAPKPSKAEKEASGKSGFVVIPVRWVVERSKSMVKNFDRTLDHANARLQLCFIRLMLKRLARAS